VWFKEALKKENRPFIVRKETNSDFGSEIEYDIAETLNGLYLGTPESAMKLCEGHDFDPESFWSPKDCNVATVAFDKKDDKWYGWSHRAIHGFGIGDMAQESCPFGKSISKEKAKDLDQAKEFAKLFAESVS